MPLIDQLQTEVQIFTTRTCPYCVKAKYFLDSEGILYDEIDVSDNAELRAEMTLRSGNKRSVPQIFVGDKHIGGCDDLYAFPRDELQNLLFPKNY